MQQDTRFMFDGYMKLTISTPVIFASSAAPGLALSTPEQLTHG
jgi:hypothetical protein